MKKFLVLVVALASLNALAGAPIYNNGVYIGCTVDGTNFSATTSAYAGGSLSNPDDCRRAGLSGSNSVLPKLPSSKLKK